jgi:glyoxylase-like metal-dependent hydrolase (beta-lactamase superfamily II)
MLSGYEMHSFERHMVPNLFFTSLLLRSAQPPVNIGKNVTQVQAVFREKYNLEPSDLPTTGEQFCQLIEDGTEWMLGKDIRCMAIATPGHTPACVSWLIGDALFAGDTLFMVKKKKSLAFKNFWKMKNRSLILTPS